MRGRAHIEGIVTFKAEIVRPRHFHADRAGARTIGADGKSNPVTLFRRKLECYRLVVLTLDGPVGPVCIKSAG